MAKEKQITVKQYFQSDLVIEKFREVLGKRLQGFVTSVLSIVSNNELLSKADPKSILNAAMIAATLDLPINQNLGFAYIIPYKNGRTGEVVAQFQMGYKGFVQLSMRSGQFKTINVSDVKEGELVGHDRLSGDMKFEWIESREKLPTIGFVAYMKLMNGFEKSFYMTVTELKAHGNQYSQSAKKGYGLWADDFDAMASKTVLKLLLSKYAPLTIQMQTAQLADQAIVKDGEEFEYIDNKKETPDEIAEDKERTRIVKFITESKTVIDLKKCEQFIDPEDSEVAKLFADKKIELEEKK